LDAWPRRYGDPARDDCANGQAGTGAGHELASGDYRP
jgi:hypothetical protein